jgi:hypothetical protein
LYWITPTPTVISIDSKEGVVAVLITTFLDRQLSKVCNLVKREIVTLMGVLPRVFPFQAQTRWKGSHERHITIRQLSESILSCTTCYCRSSFHDDW